MDDEATLRALYRAFNSRDIETALALLDEHVDWPNGWEGGRIRGRALVGSYWVRQWDAIDSWVEPATFERLPDGRCSLRVVQGARRVPGDGPIERVRHVFRLRDRLVVRMDIEPDSPDADVTGGRVERARGAELFGVDPGAYHRGRVPYPPAVLDHLRATGLAAGASVLEIGPGTGQATGLLVDAGATVTCVEPSLPMAAFLREAFPGRLVVLDSPFERAAVPAGFDMAVAATSFHWVDPARGLARLRTLVRPGGSVVLWWTLFDAPGTGDPVAAAIEPLLGADPDRPPPVAADREYWTGALRAAGLEEVTSDAVEQQVVLDADRTRALYATTATVLGRAPEERTAVLDAIHDLVRTRFDGRTSRTFVTYLYRARVPDQHRTGTGRGR